MTSKVWDKQHGGSHYQKYKIQPSKFVVENELLYPEGCAIKYINRHRDKGKKQDILKAIHFLEMIIERDYNETEYLNHRQSGYHHRTFLIYLIMSEIAIDLETKDPDLKTIGSGSVIGRSKIVGVAVAVQDWKGYYPIAHEGGVTWIRTWS